MLAALEYLRKAVVLDPAQADLHWQGKDPEANKEVKRETAESHTAKIGAMLGNR
jgi:hypothetical protein